jgi:hypothetical protein
MLDNLPAPDLDQLYTSCSTCLKSQPQNTLSCEDPCYMLLQEALKSDADQPWTYFYLAFEPWVTNRVRGYCFRYNLSDTLVDHFVNITFFRYWQSLNGKADKLNDFQHALNYLRVCARSTVLDSTKNRTETLEQELDTERLVAPAPRRDEFESLWQLVLEEVQDETERLLIRCYVVEDMKPREILEHYPGYWQDADEIKVVWQRVRRQLRRSYAIRRWFDYDETI